MKKKLKISVRYRAPASAGAFFVERNMLDLRKNICRIVITNIISAVTASIVTFLICTL